MSSKKDLAICIRAIDYSDTSQIVTLFGRDHGKIDAMAKGSKRAKSRMEGPIEIFSYGQIIFTDAGDNKLSTLSEFNQQPRFAGLRRKLHSLNAALFGAELIESFTVEHDPDPDLFETFADLLENLQQAPSEQASLARLIWFQLRILMLTGQGLVLDSCANCKNRYDHTWPVIFFSSSAHGLICRDCEASFVDKRQLSRTAGNTISNPDLLEKTDLPVLKEIEKLLVYHFSELMHKLPKMARYFVSQ